MKEKLQIAKDTVSKQYGYESFEQFDDKSTFGYDHRTPQIIDKVAIRYHELMDEWISVDTPPNNKTFVLCIGNKSQFIYQCFYQNGVFFEKYSEMNGCFKPTHWRPLPTPLKQ